MTIKTEYAPDLVLKSFTTKNLPEECIPKRLTKDETYDFLKTGQRIYWLEGEQPLLEKKDGTVSRPIASIIILEVTHFMKHGNVFTKGKFQIIKIIEPDTVYFNGCEPLQKSF
jgi:hypothetical protein